MGVSCGAMNDSVTGRGRLVSGDWWRWPGVEFLLKVERKAWETQENVGAPTFKVLL
jgi:hypothetical protein